MKADGRLLKKKKSNPPQHTGLFSRDKSSRLNGEKIETDTRRLSSLWFHTVTDVDGKGANTPNIHKLESRGALVGVFGKSCTFIAYLGRCYILQTESPRSLPGQDLSVSSTFATRVIVSTAQLTFSQRDTPRIEQSARGVCRNASGSQSHSFRFLLQLSSPCVRKITTWPAAAHLERQAADLRSEARRTVADFSQRMRNICRRSD